MKKCCICHQSKPLDSFYNLKKSNDGKQNKCKSCYKDYYLNNKNKIKIYKHQYYIDHMETIKKRSSHNRNKNKKSRNLRERNRFLNDPEYRLIHYIRTRIYKVLKNNNKSDSTINLLGCSSKFLKSYIESKFKSNMSWQNYGEWHIDHIKPCASFDLSKPEEQKICFHYSNLQPLWAKDNLSKGSKIIGVL